MSLAPQLACAVAVTLLLLFTRREKRTLAAVAKMVASSSFVWAALANGAINTSFGTIMLAGFVLCWIGDLILLQEGTGRLFRAGTITFGLAHIAYLLAFWNRGGLSPTFLLASFVTGLLASVIWSTVRNRIDDQKLRLIVAAYFVIITAMCAAAISATLSGAGAALAIGAITFAISDVAVARSRFIRKTFTTTTAGLILYYLAQMILASSILVAR